MLVLCKARAELGSNTLELPEDVPDDELDDELAELDELDDDDWPDEVAEEDPLAVLVVVVAGVAAVGVNSVLPVPKPIRDANAPPTKMLAVVFCAESSISPLSLIQAVTAAFFGPPALMALRRSATVSVPVDM